MSRPVVTATRPQLALMSYLDALLQDAAAELADSVSLDEFETAVLEEQVRDARLHYVVVPAPAPAAVISQPPIPASFPTPRSETRPRRVGRADSG